MSCERKMEEAGQEMAENEDTTERPNNVRLFQVAISSNLRNISESVSEDKFIEMLTILKSNPSKARKLHKAMIKELYRSMNDDLEDMLNEGSLQSALSKIAKLSEESTIDEEAWRPPGDTMAHLRSLDAHVITETIKELEQQVNEMERQNEILKETIAKNRMRICAASDGVTRSLDLAPVILQQLEQAREQLATCVKTIDSE